MEHMANLAAKATNIEPLVGIWPHNARDQKAICIPDSCEDSLSPAPFSPTVIGSSEQPYGDSKNNAKENLKHEEESVAIHPIPYTSREYWNDRVNDHDKSLVKSRLRLGVDLRKHLSQAYDQSYMGSCVAHAVAGAFEFAVRKGGEPNFSPSRLFIWFYARRLKKRYGNPNGSVEYDVGVSVKKALKVLLTGVCDEQHWSYEYSRSNEKTYRFPCNAKAATEPDKYARRNACQYKATYESINWNNLYQNLIACLDSGFPFIFSMNVYDQFDEERFNEKSGYIIKAPSYIDYKDKEAGHTLLAVGYIPGNAPKTELFIVRNSWGTDWGDNGHFYMAYSYLAKFCNDFFTVRLKTAPKRRRDDGDRDAQNPSKQQRLMESRLSELKINEAYPA
ncbi:cysteine proteinase [Daldinia bambusicola]|nr:cysteine proteinase [Daldinia bambusicola]